MQCGFEVEPPESDTSDIAPLDIPTGTGDEESVPEDSDVPGEAPGSDVNGMCGAAYPLAWGTQTGATEGAPTNHRGSCSGDGSETVYEFTVQEDTMICLDTFDSAFDTAIYVRENDCGDQSAEVACDDDTYGVQS